MLPIRTEPQSDVLVLVQYWSSQKENEANAAPHAALGIKTKWPTLSMDHFIKERATNFYILRQMILGLFVLN